MPSLLDRRQIGLSPLLAGFKSNFLYFCPDLWYLFIAASHYFFVSSCKRCNMGPTRTTTVIPSSPHFDKNYYRLDGHLDTATVIAIVDIRHSLFCSSLSFFNFSLLKASTAHWSFCQHVCTVLVMIQGFYWTPSSTTVKNKLATYRFSIWRLCLRYFSFKFWETIFDESVL